MNIKFRAGYLRAISTGGKRIKEYCAKGVGLGTRTEIFMHDSRLGPIAMDVPVAMGGGNTAPQPVELLLASLCGCEQVTAQFIARHLKPRVHIERIDFEIFASRDQNAAVKLPLDINLPPSRLEKIWGTATVHTASSQEQIDIIAKEVKRRCPIANMVILSGCELDILFIKA